MFNLMCLLPEKKDATSFYRGVGPMETLRRKVPSLHISIETEVYWCSLKAADAVFMQRPALDHHVVIANMAQRHRKPIWIDYDDNLFCVPFNNPTHRLYSNDEVQNNVVALVAKADVVTVSTPAIQQALVDILARVAAAPQRDTGHKLDPKKIVVVPNAYDLEVLAPLTDDMKAPNQQKLVSWRGSATHDKDLMEYTAPIKNVITKHLDWCYNFIGAPFWWTIEQLDSIPKIRPNNIMLTPTIDTIEYFEFLRCALPALMIVPLEDTPFNHGKSNIAWLEATHAGAVTLAPSWPEWQKPGVINYTDTASFERQLDKFVRGEYDGTKLWRESRNYIAKNLTLPKVNEIRAKVLDQIMRLSADSIA